MWIIPDHFLLLEMNMVVPDELFALSVLFALRNPIYQGVVDVGKFMFRSRTRYAVLSSFQKGRQIFFFLL